jgi:hypothetical protein
MNPTIPTISRMPGLLPLSKMNRLYADTRPKTSIPILERLIFLFFIAYKIKLGTGHNTLYPTIPATTACCGSATTTDIEAMPQ